MARLPNQNMLSGTPAKPSYLSAAAAAEWDRIIGELTRSGIQISEAHRPLVEAAAQTAVDMADAREVVKIEGAYLDNEKTGAKQMHPAVRRLDKLRTDYIKIMSLLGMRSAVAGGSAKEESLADLLK